MPPSLFFSDSDLQLMRETLHREPLNSAAPLLDAPPADGLARAHLLALRYVLRGEVEAGESALAALRHKDTGNSESALAATKQAFGRLSALAMLRDLPGCQDALDNEIERLPTESDSRDLLESLWAAVLRMAAGILRDAELDIASAAKSYRRATDQHIHPEGYIRGIVDIERKDNGRDSYEGQLSATCALALIAEMAAQRDIRPVGLQPARRQHPHGGCLYALLLSLSRTLALGGGLDARAGRGGHAPRGRLL